MAKDRKINDNPDLEKDLDTLPDGNKPSAENQGDNSQPNPFTKDNDLKEQDGNSSPAPFGSTGKTTITLLLTRSLRHNGVEYKGGTTLDLPTKDSDWLIQNHYAVAGSILPQGGLIIPKTHIPKAGSDD